MVRMVVMSGQDSVTCWFRNT